MSQPAFWGAALKRGQSVKVEGSPEDWLRVSNATLVGEKAARVVVTSEEDKTPRVLAFLSEKHMNLKLRRLCSTVAGVVLTNQGPGEVHLTGFFEPVPTEDVTDSEDEEAEAEEEYRRHVKKQGLETYVEQLSNNHLMGEDHDSESDADASTSEGAGSEESESEDEIAAQDRSQESKSKAEILPVASQAEGSESEDAEESQSKDDAEESESKDAEESEPKDAEESESEDAEESESESSDRPLPPAKRQCMTVREVEQMKQVLPTTEEEFVQAAVNYIQTNGPVGLAKLGSKVVRPKALKLARMQKFLQSRPEFNVSPKGFITLAQ